MTNEDKIKALAELDGLTINGPSTDPAAPEGWCWNDKGNNCWFEELKYLTSRDAIISVIIKQPPNIQNFIANNLTNTKCWTYLCTASQLADALLKATGKWQDCGGVKSKTPSAHFEPIGVKWKSERGTEFILVTSGHHKDWVCYRHTDGQWVTSHEPSSIDRLKILDELKALRHG